MAPDTGPSRSYWLLEARRTPRRLPLLCTAAGVAGVAMSHLIMPRLPRPAITILQRGFELGGMGQVLLGNDCLAVYFIVFLAGLVGLLDAVVLPREQRHLELLLSK